MSRNFLDEDEASELRAEDRARKYYNQALSRHPDCRDPDHPGCDICNDEDNAHEDD